jgi:hypothetical protein
MYFSRKGAWILEEYGPGRCEALARHRRGWTSTACHAAQVSSSVSPEVTAMIARRTMDAA